MEPKGQRRIRLERRTKSYMGEIYQLDSVGLSVGVHSNPSALNRAGDVLLRSSI